MTNTPITKKQACHIGGRKAIRSFLIIFLIYEAFLFFVETRGDIANGMLFFISGQSDPITISLYIFLALSSFFLGRLAGKKILLDNKNHILIAFLNSLLITLIIAGILAAISYARHITWEHIPFLVGIHLTVQLVLWLSATWSIRRTMPL